MVVSGSSIEEINTELLKCQLLCSYCHSEKTKGDKIRKSQYYMTFIVPLPKKEKRIKFKLTNDDVNEIRRLYNDEELLEEEISALFNVASTTISHIINNTSRIDPNYVRKRLYRLSKEDMEKRNNNIREDFHKNKLSKKELKIKYKLSGQAIAKILDLERIMLTKEELDIRAAKIRYEYYSLEQTNVTDLAIKFSVDRKVIYDAVNSDMTLEQRRIHRNKCLLYDSIVLSLTRQQLEEKYKLSKSGVNAVLRKHKDGEIVIDLSKYPY
jgi:Mor family transcriptional regulator